MKALAFLAVSSILGTVFATAVSAASEPPAMEIEMEGRLLPFLKVAAEEAERQHLPLDKYIVTLSEERESVLFVFRAHGQPKFTFGGGGVPGRYGMEVRKSDLKLIYSGYSR